DRAIRRYLGNIRQFYFTTREFAETGWLDPNEEIELERRIVLLSAFASYESENLTNVSEFLNQTIDQRNQLKGEHRKVRRLKQTKETATSLERSKKKRQQKELEKLRRKKTHESDRLLTLEQAAREMEMILVRLEKERQKQGVRKRSDEPSFFAGLKGRLSSPFKGVITVPFGNSVDKTTYLKSFSPGISIKGRAGGPVFSVAAGSVAYVGDLRGYGNFVIIDHDGIHFTTYAGIAQAEVLSGELVASGTILGKAGPDGLIKFELRKGREPLDPIKWISIDAF
ncbi:MAG: peptidoglycan DD-metalloendopeptidase family protein, partial [candidate division Zixibacteria bacterium]